MHEALMHQVVLFVRCDRKITCTWASARTTRQQLLVPSACGRWPRFKEMIGGSSNSDFLRIALRKKQEAITLSEVTGEKEKRSLQVFILLKWLLDVEYRHAWHRNYKSALIVLETNLQLGFPQR